MQVSQESTASPTPTNEAAEEHEPSGGLITFTENWTVRTFGLFVDSPTTRSCISLLFPWRYTCMYVCMYVLKYKLISYYYPAKKKETHPNAKTSDSLEKGSLSSSVSEESCWMSSGARWQSQPFGICSLSSLLLQKTHHCLILQSHCRSSRRITMCYRTKV